MAIQATTEWRVWAPAHGGSVLNGGGYDSGIAGAGTDYSDQSSPQLSRTDFATPSAGSTTLTSATGGFTAAMIGNCVRIASGTNFVPGYYFVVGHTDTNTVTLDRAASSGGAGSGGVGRLGGAFTGITNLMGIGNGGLSTPTISTPLAGGHTIWVRGSGSDDPTSTDYDVTGTGSGYWSSNPNGDGNGLIRIRGYNGRPLILTSGLLWNGATYWFLNNLKFKLAASASFLAHGLFATSAKDNLAINCRFDQNGNDAYLLVASACDCYFGNSGSTTAGTRPAVYPAQYGTLIQGCVAEDIRGDGFGSTGNNMHSIVDCYAINCGRHGFYSQSEAAGYIVTFLNCAAYGCGSDGFYLSTYGTAAHTYLRNCIAVSNGGYGYSINSGASAANDRLIRGLWDYNMSYNNTSGARLNHSAADNDVALSGDPFTNAAGGDFSLNNTAGAGAACREAGWPGVFRGISTTGYRDVGASETQDVGISVGRNFARGFA